MILKLLSNDIDTSYEQCTEAADSVLIHAAVENKLLIEHAQLITQFENEIDEYPEHVCCSCEYLYLRKSVQKSSSLINWEMVCGLD